MSHLHITCTILNLPDASLPRDLSTSCSLCLVFLPLEMHKPHTLTFFTSSLRCDFSVMPPLITLFTFAHHSPPCAVCISPTPALFFSIEFTI